MMAGMVSESNGVYKGNSLSFCKTHRMEDDLLLTLNRLREEHRMLDDEILVLLERPYFDQLLMQRLKKRKLWLKDTITRVESKLIPDLDA